jgi:SAM-dependent methyltransferase
MKRSADILLNDLLIMARATNYRDWIFQNIRAHVGQRIMEIGSGIGTYTGLLLDRKLVVAVDIREPAVAVLRERFAGYPNVLPIRADISDPFETSLDGFKPDTIICLNVLEHIRDERAALSLMHRILQPGGTLIILVPAYQWLFGSIDRLVGHERRYAKKDLAEKLQTAGFAISEIFRMNSIAVPGWFINNRVLKKSGESVAQVLFYDRFIVPWLRRVESIMHPPVGLSLVSICSKPKA